MNDQAAIGPVQAAQDPDFGQRIVLHPDVQLDDVAAALEALGFAEDDAGQGVQRLWSLNQQKPFVTLTSTPVFRLHVLDVGTVPPMLRAAIAQRVPTVGVDVLLQALRSDEAARVLHAIWALVDREEIGALEPLQQLADIAAEPVASEARRAQQVLTQIDETRRELIGGLALVAETAAEVIDLLSDVDAARSLLATPSDCLSLFTGDVASDIADLISQKPLDIGPGMRGQLVDRTTVVPAQAGLLRWHNMYSKAFPLGYRDAAGWLASGTVWVRWQTQVRAQQTMTYDGLVLVDGTWKLFPRPFRAVSQVVAVRGS